MKPAASNPDNVEMLATVLISCIWRCPFVLLQDQQVQWRDALQQLQDGSSGGASGALTILQLSQQLQGLYQQLLALPDPLPSVQAAAALTAKTQGRARSTLSLQRVAVHTECWWSNSFVASTIVQ